MYIHPSIHPSIQSICLYIVTSVVLSICLYMVTSVVLSSITWARMMRNGPDKTRVCGSLFWIYSFSNLENIDENKMFFVPSPQAFWLSPAPGVLSSCSLLVNPYLCRLLLWKLQKICEYMYVCIYVFTLTKLCNIFLLLLYTFPFTHTLKV